MILLSSVLWGAPLEPCYIVGGIWVFWCIFGFRLDQFQRQLGVKFANEPESGKQSDLDRQIIGDVDMRERRYTRGTHALTWNKARMTYE